MDTGLISRRYAKALAEYSALLGMEDRVYEQLCRLSPLYARNISLQEFLQSPMLSVEEKMAAVTGSAPEELIAPLKKFILMVLRHHREYCLLVMFFSFIELYRQRHNIKEAQLTVATDMGEHFKELVRSRMQHLSGCTVDLTCKVDPEIIGGFVFRMEDTLMDASVASQLRLLRRRLGSSPVRKI